MDALEIIQQISDESGLNWTPESMLYIVCQYIDNQQDNDCFRDFLTQQVHAENQLD